MQAYKRPPAHGIAWISQGFALWKRNPGFFAYLTIGYFVISMTLASLPLVGTALVLVVLPGLFIGVLNGGLTIHEQKKPTPDLLFSGFKNNLWSLLGIGAASLAGNIAMLLIGGLAGDASLLGIITSSEASSAEAGIPPNLLTAFALHHVLTIPVTMATLFAPPLASWQKLPTGKALFFSLIACWRNILPFCLFSLGAFFLFAVAPLFVSSVISLISVFLGQMAFVFVLFAGLSIVFASFLPMTLDIFGHDIPGHEVAA